MLSGCYLGADAHLGLHCQLVMDAPCVCRVCDTAFPEVKRCACADGVPATAAAASLDGREARASTSSTAGGAPQAEQRTGWIQPERVQGLRRAVAIAVGEKHSVALQGFWVPTLPKDLDLRSLSAQLQHASTAGALSPDCTEDDLGLTREDTQPARDMSALAAFARSPPTCAASLTSNAATACLSDFDQVAREFSREAGTAARTVKGKA
jgi:hypothetical protein